MVSNKTDHLNNLSNFRADDAFSTRAPSAWKYHLIIYYYPRAKIKTAAQNKVQKANSMLDLQFCSLWIMFFLQQDILMVQNI